MLPSQVRVSALGMASTTATTECLTTAEQRAWKSFLRGYAVLVRELDSELEATHGLPLTSFEVLARLHAAPDQRMRMGDLADAVLLSRSGLTRLVDRLARDGLLTRCSCSHDARGAFAVLTAEGERMFEAARPIHIAGVRESFLRRFDAEELEGLSEMLERLAPELAAADVADPTMRC